jgi:hypothetical protein
MPLDVVHESHCPDIGPICAERDEPPQIHDQTFHNFELRATAEYGFAEHWSAEAQIPFRITSTRIEYKRLDGTVFEPDYANIHHRDETLVGLSDPWLSARTHWTFADIRLSGRLGVTIPLGRTEPNPFVLGEMGREHQHIQFGTGTFNPLAGIELAWALDDWMLRTYAQGIVMLYENSHGYRAGHRIGGGVSADYAFVERFRASAGIDILHEEPERWDGAIMQDGNLGRTDVLAGVGVSYVTERSAATVTVKTPVYQDIVQAGDEHADLSYPIVVGVAVQTVLGAETEAPHE